MLTDIVLRKGTELTVIDAKYYRASSSSTVPGWQDIAKQMFYELAVCSVAGGGYNVRNCFAFPSSHDGTGPFKNVEMLPRGGGEPLTDFPSIECHYFSAVKVMRAYVEQRVELEVPPGP